MMSKKSSNFTQLSIDLTKQISKEDKKNNGIFFTPHKTIMDNLNILNPYMKNIKRVLEPSCGSCEYIMLLNKVYGELSIDGIEFNKTIFDTIKDNNIEIQDKINLLNYNYLLYDDNIKYDLVIGNPPYYVMKKNDVPLEYHEYFDGRPNIFILFIIKSLKCLNDDGILSFILPKSFLNCLYYNKTRKYISDNFRILHISECSDDFIETKQETIIFIIQKSTNTENNENTQNTENTENNQRFIIMKQNYTIFGLEENIIKFNKLYNGTTTLSQLNFEVNVGNIVWNQCKNILSNDSTDTLLIYSSDIINNKLKIKTYNNPDKKNYIKKSGIDMPLLVINRGYGMGNYKFDYCLIEGGFEYLIENHLICIKYKNVISNKELIKKYKTIIESLKNEKTQEFIRLYFGNNAINTTELCDIVPLFI